MPASTKRSGKRSRKSIRPVPSGIAAVIAITLSSCSASFSMLSLNQAVHALPFGFSGTIGCSTAGSTGTFFGSGFFADGLAACARS